MPWLEITVQGHLLVAGGQASDSSADLTTSRRFYEGRLVPYIPATALRGAVRIQLEALLRGGGQAQEVVEPYPFDGPATTHTPIEFSGAVPRLFGYSGPASRRDGAGEGAIRFGDALPENPERAERTLRVRPGLELDDYTTTAEDRKLFFREVAEVSAERLVFRAPLTVVDGGRLREGDLELLQAAAETTDAIGAGKSKGGGEVTIRWLEEESSPAAAVVAGDPATATRARLLLTLLEPAHFGDGGAYGNHHATRTFIPGATVRGAVAWALLRSGRTRPEDDGFKALFLAEPASFGDALLVHQQQAEPAVVSATARRPRGPHGDLRNILATELARERINRMLAASDRYVQVNEGAERLIPVEPARPSAGLVRTTRTRLSIDRWTGTAAAGRLFSIEQIDPALSLAGRRCPARFVSWIEGLTPAAAQLLARLEGLPLLVGAGRKHGLGLVHAALRFAPDPADDLVAKARSFADSVEERTAELCRRVGLEGSSRTGGELPLALVALADYIPSGPDIDHPLAEPELAGLAVGRPLRQFLNGDAAGGYDQRPENGAPLKDLFPAVSAGSVYVYSLAEEDLRAVLELTTPTLRRGVGRRVESGCGRFGLFELEVAKEIEMKPEAEQGLKTWMVESAEAILDGVKDEHDFRGATAQLRNLIQITQRESEVAVLENFLNYQRGRRATRDFWRLIHGRVVEVLHEIEKRTADQGEEVRRLAIQQFFGYLVRHYVYLDQLNEDAYRAARAAGSAGR